MTRKSNTLAITVSFVPSISVILWLSGGGVWSNRLCYFRSLFLHCLITKMILSHFTHLVYCLRLIKAAFLAEKWLKGLAHAIIIKKSVILFWLLSMTIWCKHVHRLELRKFFALCAAHSPVRLDIERKFLIPSLTGKCADQKLKNFCSSSLWTCLHHMVILRSQNKITDFFNDFSVGQCF